VKQVKQLRTILNVSKDEMEMLKEKHFADFLPEGWFFNGSYYLHVNGDSQISHPNFGEVIKTYLDEQNAVIGTYNREVQKEIKNEQKMFES